MTRRLPRQKRSESTVDHINQTVIKLIDTAAAAKLTTFRVAERAVVSGGTQQWHSAS